MTTIFWSPDSPSHGVTSYLLEKSTDKALTWGAPVEVLADFAGPNYDRASKRFMYAEAANPGDVYRIRAVGRYGTSDYEFAIVPPAPPALCRIIGYELTAFASVDTSSVVHVEGFGSSDRWVRAAGTVAQNVAAIGVRDGRRTVYPDAAGVWQVDLVQGAVARVRIPALRFEWAFIVPARRGPVNIRDIQCLRGPDFQSALGEPRGAPLDIIATGV